MNADGFMGFWSDIDSDYRPRYREWHNCEHIPERISIPGFIEGRRYRALNGGPTFFMCYITENPGVLSGEHYLAALNRPTPWTKEALTHFREPERSIYRRILAVGSAPVHAPYIVLLRFNDERPAREIADRLEAWGTANTPDLSRVALYDMDTDASHIMTAERRIYSAGPGQRQYLATVELVDKSAIAAVETSLMAALEAHARDLAIASYWIEMRIRAVDVLTMVSSIAAPRDIPAGAAS
jgi:hypothetical protein